MPRNAQLCLLALALGASACSAPSDVDFTDLAETASQTSQAATPQYDYVYDKNSPYLKATKRHHAKSLKADGNDDIRWYFVQNYAITVKPANIANVRPMVEWEPMKALVLQWPSGYLGNQSASKTMLDIAKNASEVANVIIVTDPGGTSKTKNALLGNGVSQNTINNKFFFQETVLDSIWFIDSGPLPIVDKQKNTFAFADFRYYHERPYDDGVPTILGRNLGDLGFSGPTATYRMPVNTEGGTFQATTDGICVTSTRQLWHMTYDNNTGGAPSWNGFKYVNINTIQNHSTVAELKTQWGKYLGCKDVLVVHSVTDDGTGHLDMFFKLVDDNTIIIGEYKAPYQANTQQQQNAQLLDESAAFLANYTKPDGSKFKVHRMIMPGHRSTNEGMVPFTYLNSTFVNKVNLWPAFTFPEWEASRAQAEAKWKQVMPDYKHTWIDSTTLSFWSGAIHCITRTLPDLPPGPWVADGSCSGGMCQAPAGGYDDACQPNQLTESICWGPEWLCDCNNCGTGCGYTPEGAPPAGCDGVTFEGCCDGNVLKYCEGNKLNVGTCNNSCGWDAGGGYYNCGANGADPSGNNPIECPGQCVKDCAGVECGDDGCGGTCGSCGAGESCNALGQCEGGCEASCDGKSCGDDGCGGTCGSCAAGETCNALGQCEGCVPNCNGKACGDNGCGGTCGTCADGQFCNGSNQCEAACVPNCTNKACGSDGCGSTCGTCGADEYCEAGACKSDAGGCGGVTYEGCCDGNTLKYCDNGLQELNCGSCGWNNNAGFYDCNQSGADPSGENPIDCPGSCVASCDGKSCGSDGCGGDCGACGPGETCTDAGACISVCEPACDGKACGGDGCGGICGTCDAGKSCTAEGQCEAVCAPACDGKVCGDDGCGGSCGSCAQGTECNDLGQCEALCTADCTGKSCGSDGCGGSCGTCPNGALCDADGQCISDCAPACAGKNCGDDGCGGTCGACQPGDFCDDAGLCQTPPTSCGDIPAEGQCQGNVVLWCQDDAVQSFDCSAQNLVCGYDEDKGYTCVEACTPVCDGKACGDDGCGGSCGACGEGEICSVGVCGPDDVKPPVDPNLNTNGSGSTSEGCATASSSSQGWTWGLFLSLLGFFTWRRRFSPRPLR